MSEEIKNVEAEKNPKAKGSTLLLIGGILLLAVGAWSLIDHYPFLNDATYLAKYGSGYESAGQFWQVTEIFYIVTSAIALIAGLLSVVFHKNVKKAGLCIICGAIAFGLLISFHVLTFIGGNGAGTKNLFNVYKLIAPIVAIVGGSKNAKDDDEKEKE